ncbi:hypothetical protein PGT21_004447 [Puccinia graminis f. sp. tritici]|uniref:Uncharacterized protein n=1 Tax=Puccinia graminis f. sp. tritici TaxID=56615 RepID=A0A5B0MJK0_PUCGR|nr:hypothetical protein PGT21_004447 [Puccinia graminis f. sp. tritici]
MNVKQLAKVLSQTKYCSAAQMGQSALIMRKKTPPHPPERESIRNGDDSSPSCLHQLLNSIDACAFDLPKAIPTTMKPCQQPGS